MKIDKKLIKKYNQAVPRYTSYPPANHFTTEFSEKNYIELLKKSNSQKPEYLAFYFHVPFCKQICHYCGCNTCLLGYAKLVKPYFEAQKKEIELVSQYIDKERFVTQIHYGGGTPNSVSANYIAEINNLIFENFKLAPHAEIAIETNPAYLDFDYLDKLKKLKFNRFSLGIQDFNNKVLETVNRLPSKVPVRELVKYLKNGSQNISVNLDFIYGLPFQTKESFAKTITQASEIKPDRLTTFSYAHVPWVKDSQKVLEKYDLPNAEQKTAMFYEANKILKQAGYKTIGFDHYVLPDDDLFKALETNNLHRNFQGYCTRKTTGQVIAFGTSSISQLTGGFAQNTKNIPKYIETVNSGKLPTIKGYKISENQNITKEVITDLMCNFSLNWEQIANRLDISVERLKNNIAYEKSKLTDFENDKLLISKNDDLKITEKGKFFIRNIAATLDPDFKNTENTYSKSI